MSLTKSALLFLYVLSTFFTGAFTISKGSGEGVSSASFQLHHLIFIVMFIYQTLLRKNDKGNSRIIIPSFWLLLFAIYSLFGAIAFIPRFGLQALVLNFIYALSVVILFFSVYRDDDMNVIADVIGNAFLCALIAIIIKDIVYAQILISYFSHGGGGHPAIKSYAAGGVNVEASLLGMYCVFTMNKKYGLAAWFTSFVISCLYSSRTAFLLNICVLLWYLAFVKRAFSNLNVKMLLVIVPVVFAVTYYVMTSSLGAVMINRFMKTGDDAGSVGRIRMWEHVGTVIEQYPLGVGVGNAIVAVRQLSQSGSIEGNMHNIFFQYAMEQGVVVGSAFLILGSLWLFRREMKIKFTDPFGVYLLLYLVQGALQSRGVDATMAVILGLYFVSRKKSP